MPNQNSLHKSLINHTESNAIRISLPSFYHENVTEPNESHSILFTRKRSATYDPNSTFDPQKKARSDDTVLCEPCVWANQIENSSTLNALWQLPSMIHAFDLIPHNHKTYLLFQLLKRSSIDTLQFVNAMIMPILKRDFLSTLPLELSKHITRCLDPFSLARASCVSKKWKTMIDSDDELWKTWLLQDGYSLHDPIHPLLKTTSYKTLYARHHTLRQNWRKGRAQEKTFRGHDTSVVTCLQFDDDKIVSGADDAYINIYDTATGKKRMTLEGHEGGVWALQYVENTLVTGSTDRRVHVWNMETGKCTHVFTGHTSTIRCLLITEPVRQGGPRMIITGSRDATLRVWKLPDANDQPFSGDADDVNPFFIQSLIGHRQSVRAIASHKNIIVSGSYDSTVRVWDLHTGHSLHVLEGHTQKVYTVVIDSDRNRCMSGSLDSTVRVWDLKTGQCLWRLEGHTVLVGLLGLTDQCLVSAAADAVIRIWSTETGVCYHALSGHRNSITCFQHDNHKIISGAEGGVKIWDVKTGKFENDLIKDVDVVWRLGFNARRCIAAVQKKNETSFRILDFGIHHL
ncbi:WD40-repeat-containing domain protein [Gilbertella persicaria]|uniref:WD40-repeat-containing domain protein n=1 Tax=Gilbertella persicaria TaxID=101096 RepID=UPI00221E645F|nr:WD40-repeat-containing domain protein [Gilbertella persicaria]KAI8066277.1 WD40-repeat-containing domain protein [Gilbertella persicaria]